MQTHVKATFSLKSWDEKPYKEMDGGAKFTQAHVQQIYQGDLEAESSVEYLMFYDSGGKVKFVGLEYVEGKIGGRSGAFVLQHEGMDENGAVKSNYFVVPGSGTGELRGLRGEGSFLLAGESANYPFTLDYSFE